MGLQQVEFGKTGWAISFQNCENIIESIPKIFHGWNISVRQTESAGGQKPRARVSFRGGRWTWQPMGAPKPREWDSIPPRSAMRVLTDVHDAALHWYLAEHPRHLCLHGAAAMIGNTLVTFPARGFTGKSTLMACLAKMGHKIFADDVLLLSGPRCTGMSLGFSPRLRLPLPANLTKASRDFITSHAEPASNGWAYVTPPSQHLARLGEKAPVGAIVLLQRTAGARASLEAVKVATALKPAIQENITRQLPMIDIFNRLHRLTSKCERLRLIYDKPDEAALLLSEHFS